MMTQTPARHSERRASPRCRTPIRVLIADPGDALEDPYPAMILDRSKGGLRLSVGHLDIEEGTVLGVQPTEWGVSCEVRVVHRSRQNDAVELGCAFVQANGWDTVRK